MISLYAGLTSQTIDLFIQDSSSTTGAGKTGLAYNTSGLAICYRKGATGSFTAITLATQTVGGAWSSGGFVELDSTNAAGTYRLDIPNAAIDTAGFVTLYVKGTGVASAPVRIDCRALPADAKSGTITSVSGSVGSVTGAVGSVTGNLGGNVNGNVSGSVGSVTGAVGSVTGSVGSVVGNVGGDVAGKVLGGGSGTISGDGVRAASVTGAVGSVTGAVGSVTNLQADIRTAVGMASANLDTQLSAIKTDTAVARSAGVVQIGVISNAGTQVESYTYGGQTVTFAGLDSSGNRSGVTVT